METSDDFLTGGGDGGVDIPTNTSREAENVKRTAKPAEQLSEEARRKRRRRAAGVNRNDAQLKLSVPGLLGIPAPQGGL